MLICVHRATRGSGRLIKTQVLYEHTLAGHTLSGTGRQASTLSGTGRQVIFLLFDSYAQKPLLLDDIKSWIDTIDFSFFDCLLEFTMSKDNISKAFLVNRDYIALIGALSFYCGLRFMI